MGPEHHKCKLWRHSDTQSRECGAQQYHVPKTTPTGPKNRPRRHDQDPRTIGAESLAKDVINFQADLKELREEQKVIAALPGAQPLIGETIKTIEMIPKYFEIAFIVAASLLAFFVLKRSKTVLPQTQTCVLHRVVRTGETLLECTSTLMQNGMAKHEAVPYQDQRAIYL